MRYRRRQYRTSRIWVSYYSLFLVKKREVSPHGTSTRSPGFDACVFVGVLGITCLPSSKRYLDSRIWGFHPDHDRSIREVDTDEILLTFGRDTWSILNKVRLKLTKRRSVYQSSREVQPEVDTVLFYKSSTLGGSSLESLAPNILETGSCFELRQIIDPFLRFFIFGVEWLRSEVCPNEGRRITGFLISRHVLGFGALESCQLTKAQT